MAVSQSNKNGLAGVVLIAVCPWRMAGAVTCNFRKRKGESGYGRPRLSPSRLSELFGKDRFMKISIGQAIDSSWRQLYKIGSRITLPS